MDIRGIEVTNQLRSAIRAKLLELGVRYDEELPDYILVMVVNKKTRQQMFEDLNLFLEGSTEPFVEWLHDQVLKKLQKVTIAKKKRDLVPTVVVKQEEERRKKLAAELGIKTEDEIKEEKNNAPSKTAEKSPAREEEERTIETNDDLDQENGRVATIDEEPESSPPPTRNSSNRHTVTSQEASSKQSNTRKSHDESEEDNKSDEPEAEKERASSEEPSEPRRLKSCVNKPRITSVVSIKDRLGVTSPRRSFDNNSKSNRSGRSESSRSEKPDFPSRSERPDFRSRNNSDGFPSRSRTFDSRISALRNSNDRRSNDRRNNAFQRGRNFEEDSSRRNKDSTRQQSDQKQHRPAGSLSIKERLGSIRVTKSPKRDAVEEASRVPKPSGLGRNVKSRLGPIKRPSSAKIDSVVKRFHPESEKEDPPDEEEDEKPKGPVKSRIIAVNCPPPVQENNSKKRKPESETEEEDDREEAKIPSKVIVTPRPLKPLQPAQKRATQSLLLRAVAEANQSVIRQKNPEPAIAEDKATLKRPKTSGVRDLGQNLSVHLNKSKRLVMEKIQVEFTRDNDDENIDEPYVPMNMDEHMGVVMSLFQKNNNDSQKFLVTLNGYNNNIAKESSEDEEQLEMEVNEDDEFALSTSEMENYAQDESNASLQYDETEMEESLKDINLENNENCDTRNFELENQVSPRKRRKLSPIVYTRSPSPEDIEINISKRPSVITKPEVLRIADITVNVGDKSKEKCRFWPNCTLGFKCAFQHPAVLCSAFPACKFGSSCAYKHPNCKFGLACTKLGCPFSHPTQQCKYHPFCTKPACPYLHPKPEALAPKTSPAETVGQRAKFTWRRRD